MNTSEKAKLTAFIRHIEVFPKSGILIFNNEILEKSQRGKKKTIAGLPANLEIREKSGDFQFLTKIQEKRGKVREKLFVAMITFNNVFFIVYFNFYYL